MRDDTERTELWFLLIEGPAAVGKSAFAQTFFREMDTFTVYASRGETRAKQNLNMYKIAEYVAKEWNVVVEGDDGADLTRYAKLAQNACDQAGYRMARVHLHGAE